MRAPFPSPLPADRPAASSMGRGRWMFTLGWRFSGTLFPSPLRGRLGHLSLITLPRNSTSSGTLWICVHTPVF